MKKKIILLILLITGCSLNKQTVDLEIVKDSVNSIKSSEIDFNQVVVTVEKSDTYDKMEYIKEDNLSSIGLNSNDLEDFVIRKSTEESEKYGLYIILKPKSDKVEEIKKMMTDYFNKLIKEEKNSKHYNLLSKRVEFEYNGYLIYVVGDNSQVTLSKIIESKKQVFSTLVEIGKNDMKELRIANSEDMDNYLIQLSGNLDKVNSYFIIKPKENKIEDIKEDIENYFNKQKETFVNNQEQLQILEKRLETEINDYLVYIVSTDNDKVLDLIQQELK